MKLLLDTHVLLWSLLEPGHLSEEVRTELEKSRNELWLSPITIWEVLLLAERGRVHLLPDPVRWIRRVLNAVPFREAPLTNEVALLSRRIDLPHQDPADRFLVATATLYDLTFLTADERILSARPCPTRAAR